MIIPNIVENMCLLPQNLLSLNHVATILNNYHVSRLLKREKTRNYIYLTDTSHIKIAANPWQINV